MPEKKKPRPKPKPPATGRGSKAGKARKAEIVARGIVRGQSTPVIAKAAGCCARHVQRLAAEETTQLLITDLMRPHRAQLARCVPLAIAAIARGLKAKKKEPTQDHYVQLGSIDRLKTFLELTQGKTPETPPDEKPQFTWEEILVMYRARIQTTHATTDPTYSTTAG